MQNTTNCPECGVKLGVMLQFKTDSDKARRISFPPPILSRSHFYMNIIYLLIGAVLALAGVTLPGCSDDSSFAEYDTETGSGEQLQDDTETGSGEQLQDDTETGSGEQLQDDTNPFTAIVGDCDEMKDFFSDCYWSEETWSGPTFDQMKKACSSGSAIDESLSQWHACWSLEENSCNCPGGAMQDVFSCHENKCQQFTACMIECRL